MTKKRCVIFGGGGFIGSYLAEALTDNNYEVVVFARGSKKDYSNLSRLINKITFIKGSIENIELIKKTVKPKDIVFNLISSSLPISSMNKPIDEIKDHIFTNVLLAQTVFKIGIKKYVFASSGGGVYGHKKKFPIGESASILPSSPHAIAKASIEFYLNYFSEMYSIPVLIYRISNAFGPRQSLQKGFGIIPTIMSSIRTNSRPILFNKGKIIRDFIFIEDLIQAMLISFDKKTKYQVYNLGSGRGTSINTIWNIIKKLSPVKITPVYKKKRPIDVDKVILDINRFTTEFHWKPKYGITAGIKKTLSQTVLTI
ncbi:hypothetical protein A2866_04010 [Candidatus Roizmanbacteria bacterium RIFCSPHIGHO2_01_FULL_39_8]|uniref:NAD-dependent epimerase/dehydratase domain-containing protein n=3 Tax=Candidatus Roizmaniibacteriota TaxID=1752723 RepID=A0A1F7GPK3_9BACT|nr:MAG: hypothetical protein A2866_04010 [Candidatus Roizmanbacteria bacterium RIFCSPHIGHO2_01_FULL_39_8]OGK26612.1 MAG: hypothetical protein A3C28_03850 [Candidatus Roizmanbacteria bacterium RIFCSPHIGHO2_02_FULL_39_9]OGK35176.1 MAG: hypothetical protein A3F60_02800 [Candidatus Roizmanbacteria bacterium RIFCSPHIGHO2_12_FULL_39_8]